MTNPKTGWMTREWEVETFANVAPKGAGLAVLSSAKFTFVSEAIFLNSQGPNQAYGATVVGHDRSIPDQGSVSSTQAATLAPQQFTAVFTGLGGSLIGTLSGTASSTIQAVTFLIRGR